MANDLNQLVTVALQRCGQRQTDTAILMPQIVLEVPNVQVSLEDEMDEPLPWFLKTIADQGAWLQTTQGVNTIALPATFLKEVESADLYVVDTDPSTGFQSKRPLEKLDYDDIQVQLARAFPRYSQTLPYTGRPRWYCLDSGNILLFPTPDQEYQLEWSYYSRDVVLTNVVPATLTNKWTLNAWNLMLAKLSMLVASAYLRDTEMANDHGEIYKMEHQVFRGRCIERDLANHSMHMGQGK